MHVLVHLFMGKKIPIVTYLCGVLGRRKSAPAAEGDSSDGKQEDGSADPCTTGDAAAGKTPTSDHNGDHTPGDDVPLSSQPGARMHNRTTSCRVQASERGGIAAKLKSSVSMRLPGHVNVGRQLTRLEEKAGIIRDKKLKHEDSIWKKPIILGERNKVPNQEEEEMQVYDEDGNPVTTYRPKPGHVRAVSQFARPDEYARPPKTGSPEDRQLP